MPGWAEMLEPPVKGSALARQETDQRRIDEVWEFVVREMSGPSEFVILDSGSRSRSLVIESPGMLVSRVPHVSSVGMPCSPTFS